MTACHHHQPLSVTDDEITFQQRARADDISGMEALVAQLNVITQDEEDEPALLEAARNDKHDVVNSLLEHGADPDAQRNYFGMTALMVAAINGHAFIVGALLKGGAQPDLLDNNGMTALIMAARAGHLDIVKALLTGGAKHDIKDDTGSTAP